jgi:hypothetical protein
MVRRQSCNTRQYVASPGHHLRCSTRISDTVTRALDHWEFDDLLFPLGVSSKFRGVLGESWELPLRSGLGKLLDISFGPACKHLSVDFWRKDPPYLPT